MEVYEIVIASIVGLIVLAIVVIVSSSSTDRSRISRADGMVAANDRVARRSPAD